MTQSPISRVSAMIRNAVVAGLIALGMSPVAGSAQGSGLAGVQALVSEGRFDAAREALQVWLDSSGSSATREDAQHGLWLKALLTVDAQMAEIDLQRLVVEYRGGSYSDEALLRLAHLANARADRERAQRRLETLIQDYPQSPLVGDARTMLSELREMPASPSAVAGRGGRPASDPTTVAAVPLPSDPSVSVAPEPVAPEPVAPDADAPAPVAPEPVVPDADAPPVAPDPVSPGPVTTDPVTPEPAVLEPGVPEPPVLAPAAPPDGLSFTVQLGAFSTESRAATLAAAADAAGIEVRLVTIPGTGLIHVRTGAFSSREEADARAEDLRGRGLSALIATDRYAETPLH